MRSSTIYEIEGLLLKGGVAKDGIHGVNHNFTPDIVQKIFDHMTTGIHCELKHDGENVGYIHKWWLTDGNKDIGYNALIYEPKGIVAIRDEGFSHGSPDLDLYYDDDGNLADGYLRKLAFVNDPAMDSTGVHIIRAAFSRQQGDSSMVDKTEGDSQESNVDVEEDEQTEEEIEETTDEQIDSTEEEDESSEEDSDEPTLGDVMKLLKQERDARKKLESKLDSAISDNKKLANAQLESLKADVKARGINPDGLIKGLNDKQAMQVLRSLKTDMAGKRSFSTTPPKTGKSGGSKKSKPDEVFTGSLQFLGMDEETYLELSGKKKGE